LRTRATIWAPIPPPRPSTTKTVFGMSHLMPGRPVESSSHAALEEVRIYEQWRAIMGGESLKLLMMIALSRRNRAGEREG
jgi:hypothetical protein